MKDTSAKSVFPPVPRNSQAKDGKQYFTRVTFYMNGYSVCKTIDGIGPEWFGAGEESGLAGLDVPLIAKDKDAMNGALGFRLSAKNNGRSRFSACGEG